MPRRSSFDLDAATVRSLLDYDPATGIFRWRTTRGSVCAGTVAGSVFTNGYRHIKIDGKSHLASRLAFLHVTGEWPAGQVDHENRDRDDNRWSNLRTASGELNNLNRGVFRNNTSGHKGVIWNKRLQKWVALIGRGGKQVHLGTFTSVEAAGAAYRTAHRRETELRIAA